MKTEKKRNLEKLMLYIYIIVSFFVAFMYLCKPIASAHNPPRYKKKERNGLPKVHGIIRTLLASILVSIVIFFLM